MSQSRTLFIGMDGSQRKNRRGVCRPRSRRGRFTSLGTIGTRQCDHRFTHPQNAIEGQTFALYLGSRPLWLLALPVFSPQKAMLAGWWPPHSCPTKTGARVTRTAQPPCHWPAWRAQGDRTAGFMFITVEDDAMRDRSRAIAPRRSQRRHVSAQSLLAPACHPVHGPGHLEPRPPAVARCSRLYSTPAQHLVVPQYCPIGPTNTPSDFPRLAHVQQEQGKAWRLPP